MIELWKAKQPSLHTKKKVAGRLSDFIQNSAIFQNMSDLFMIYVSPLSLSAFFRIEKTLYAQLMCLGFPPQDGDYGAWIPFPGLSTRQLTAPKIHRETSGDAAGGGQRKAGQRKRERQG